MNIDCPKKTFCDCKKEQKQLQGRPDHVKYYQIKEIYRNGDIRERQYYCYAEAETAFEKLKTLPWPKELKERHFGAI